MSPKFLISPTEPSALRGIGVVSPLPEKFGADVVWASRHGLVGVSRKTPSDLIASVNDKRLLRQVNNARENLAIAMLLLEGQPREFTEGALIESPSWTLDRYRNVLLSVQATGMWLLQSRDLTDTIRLLYATAAWLEKETHSMLSSYGNARGKFDLPPTKQEKLAFVVQAAFPGIGPKRALALVTHFGGWPWATCCNHQWPVDEFLAVPGIGKTWAAKLAKGIVSE